MYKLYSVYFEYIREHVLIAYRPFDCQILIRIQQIYVLRFTTIPVNTSNIQVRVTSKEPYYSADLGRLHLVPRDWTGCLIWSTLHDVR
jgi:hypothetical protein